MKVSTTAQRLKEIMEERDLKQVDIIRLCEPYCKKYNAKLTRNYISQYLSGRVEPGQHTLFVLGKALNVSEPWLMGFDVPKERTSIEQSDESHVLKAIYNDKKLNTEDIQKFLNKKLLDRIDAIDMEMFLINKSP